VPEPKEFHVESQQRLAGPIHRGRRAGQGGRTIVRSAPEILIDRDLGLGDGEHRLLALARGRGGGQQFGGLGPATCQHQGACGGGQRARGDFYHDGVHSVAGVWGNTAYSTRRRWPILARVRSPHTDSIG